MNFPVPNFCLVQRFVRPNYAQSETDLGRLASPDRPTGGACLKFLHHKPQIAQWDQSAISR
jgi:hypothetical protein